MAQEKANRLVEWYLALKEWAPTVPARFHQWREAVRAEPSLIWQTLAVRYATYGLVGFALLTVVSAVPGWFVGPPPADARPLAVTADFHVVCSKLECGYHFVTNQKKGFRKFPITCLRCKQKSAVHGRRCRSDSCSGQWVAPVEIEHSLRCTQCGRALLAEPRP